MRERQIPLAAASDFFATGSAASETSFVMVAEGVGAVAAVEGEGGVAVAVAVGACGNRGDGRGEAALTTA